MIGAAVGAIGGLGGGFLAVLGQSRHLREQRNAEQERWRNELRRDAYYNLLASAKQLSNALWKAGNQLNDTTSSRSDWQTCYHEVRDTWTQFSAAAAAVNVAGPATVADTADAYRSAMFDWEMLCLAWVREALRSGVGHLEPFATDFNNAAETKRPRDRALQVAARKALGTED